MANTHSLDLEVDSSQYAYINNLATINGVNAMTVEFWLKPETLAVNRGIVSRSDGATANQFTIAQDGNAGFNAIQVSIAANAGDWFGNYFRFSNDTLASGSWKHYAVVYDGSLTGDANRLKLYVNGVQDTIQASSGSVAASLTTITQPLQIGNRGSGESNYYDGLIDEVRIWTAARTEAQILANYQRELGGGEPNLVAYWKLNNAYTDSSTAGNTLTASGSPVFSTDIPFVSKEGSFLLNFV